MIFDLKSVLGAIPSPWDIKHYRVPRATLLMATELPVNMSDLRSYTPSPFPYQGDIGSCVGWDGDNVMEITNRLEDKEIVKLSAGWLYYRSRYYAKVPDYQEGSTNLGLMQALNREGATTEICAPTDIESPFTIDYCTEAYEIAKNYAIDEYWMVNPNPSDIKAAIMGWTHEANYKMPDGSLGKIPLVSAYPVYKSYYEAFDNGGVVPMPKQNEKPLGGHSSTLIGWKEIDDGSHFDNLNSWGKDKGDNGHFYIPEEYPFYPFDFWLIHNGLPTNIPDPTPSPCNVGRSWAKCNNLFPWLGRRRGRFHYMNAR